LNIHVGNLSRETTEEELRQEFEQFGRVETIRIITDRYSGVSKGFGFVEMPETDEGKAAIAGLHRKELAGRTLDVSEAHGPRERGRNSRPFGGGGRPGGGGGFGRSGGGGYGRSGGGGGRRRF